MSYIGRNPATYSNQVVKKYVAGTDFTAGTTTTLTLPEDPGSANVVCVYIDGVYQEHSEFTVQGTVLTFTTAIPSGTGAVEVTLVKALNIGVPSDGTVTTAKLADAAVTSAKTASVIGGLGNVQVYTANTTWTKPSGLKRVKVIVIGGGGSGGGTSDSSSRGVGGGGGGGSIKIIEAASLGTTENVTVGAGGSAVTGNNNGNSGGTSSFGTHCSASGGGGGYKSAGTALAGIAGGSASGGNINVTGGSSTSQSAYSSNQGVPPAGNSPFGFGFGGCLNVGTAGVGYGGGGAMENHAGGSSGAGASGIVIVEEYF